MFVNEMLDGTACRMTHLVVFYYLLLDVVIKHAVVNGLKMHLFSLQVELE